ncbi:MAG TPA: hypothetical protein VFZ76_04410 [Anaerolineales bacterium]
MNPRSETNLLSLLNTHVEVRAKSRWMAGVICLVSLVLLLVGRTEIAARSAKAAALPAASSFCQPFEQVNENAFGLGPGADNAYAGEEGFEVAVFNNQLYLGMEADNSMGARLWRTKAGITQPESQADWEEVAVDADGNPFGITVTAQADHIDSLLAFDGYLYASTANGGSNILGTRIFRSATGDPGTWEDAIAGYGAGFGDVDNMNFKDMQVFQGNLCGGTQNWRKGAQVWCTGDGTTWTQKNVSGFGNGKGDVTNREVWSGHVFNAGLYFGVQNLGNDWGTSADDVGKLYRTTDLAGDPKWTEVYVGDPGSHRVDILGDLNGYLYISLRSPYGMVILRSPNGNANSWSQVNTPGMNTNLENSGAIVDGATVYDNMLYIAASNTSTGVELWRTTGALQGVAGQTDWEQVDAHGLGDAKNYYAQLVAYQESLYAWTSNYTTGQQVLRTGCSQEGEAGVTPTPTATTLVTVTPVPTGPPSATPPAPTTSVTPTENPSLTPTQTPEPTAQCPFDTSNCQEENVGASQPLANFLPLAIKTGP